MSFALLGILQSQTLAAGGAGAYDLLETTVLTSDTSSVSFTGLDSYSDYKHLQIRIVSKATFANNGPFSIKAEFNGTPNTYVQFHRLEADGSTVVSQANVGLTDMVWGKIPTTQATTDGFGAAIVDILDFSSSVKNTTVRGLSGHNTSLNSNVALISNLMPDTTPVTQITLDADSADYTTGSRFSLYGIKG